MKKKILIISRAFPPAGGGGVQRIVKFGIYLQELGWDVTVCTIDGENYSWIDEVRLKEIERLKVIRIDEKAYKSTFLNKVINRLKFYDYYNDWAIKVSEYFKKKQKEFDYNFVLTSGPPHSVHNIGLSLKRKFNIYWISDFRDPFTLGPTYKAFSRFHKIFDVRIEQKIYNVSDLIINNTEINRKETLGKFKINPESKIFSIYNGYDFGDLKVTNFSPDFDSNKLNLIYLGGLRGDHIDGYFYQMLKKVVDMNSRVLDEMQIHLVGDLSRQGSMIDKLGIARFFKNHKAVPYNKVGDYIKAVDGCLTWQHPNDKYRGTIAGKVFDYIGMKKPIFSLGQSRSELDNIINSHEIGMHTDVNNIEEAADDFIRFLENIPLYNKKYEELSKPYFDSFYRKNQVVLLNKVLEDVSN